MGWMEIVLFELEESEEYPWFETETSIWEKNPSAKFCPLNGGFS